MSEDKEITRSPTSDKHQSSNMSHFDDDLSLNDEICIDPLKATVVLTRQELDSCISEPVHKALSAVTGLLGLATLLSGVDLGMSRFSNPVFSFSPVAKEEKLVCTKNYTVWCQRLELDL